MQMTHSSTVRQRMKHLIDLSKMFNSVIHGWINYYGKFYKFEMYHSITHINKALIIGQEDNIKD